LGVLKLQQDDPTEAVRLIGFAIDIDRKSVSAYLTPAIPRSRLRSSMLIRTIRSW
jgi:hypothetical protein